jgi:hypothetical protein
MTTFLLSPRLFRALELARWPTSSIKGPDDFFQ